MELSFFDTYNSIKGGDIMEIWKDIKGYEGLYQVSNMGRIKSLGNDKTRKEKILSLKPNNKGYIIVHLCKNGKRKHFSVHRLVAEAFLPNPDNLPVVNHKIDDFEHRSDNRVENLEWCTVEYNNNYGTHNKKLSKSLKGKKHKKHKLKKQILCVETGEIFDTSQDVIDIMFNGKGSQSNIRNHLNGRRKSAYGYHFKYIERENY